MSAMSPRPEATCWRLPRVTRCGNWTALASAASSLTLVVPTNSKAAICRLLDSFQKLVVLGGEVCAETEEGSEQCSAFLMQVDRCASALRAKTTSRAYRTKFTVHYRAAVPDGGRHYRVEVLSASLAQHGAIWVNGAKFEFSAEVMRRGVELKRQLAELCTCLSDMVQKGEESPKTNAKVFQASRTELCTRLEAFDVAWVGFEQAYINQLIEIEKSARGILVEAFQHERSLRCLEASAGGAMPETGPSALEYADVQRRLFACLSRLNSVANVNRKGREDLSPEVFNVATVALRNGLSDGSAPNSAIIIEVVDAYEAMRDYLRRVEPFLDQVAPRLSENAGLAARLAQLEEGWELGATYLLKKPMCDATCSIVKELKGILRSDPRLSQLCETCDVEWLLVLPKLLWLCYLEHPTRHVEVLRHLLPQHFAEATIHTNVRLQDLQASYARARHALRFAALPRSNGAWDILVRQVSSSAGGPLKSTDTSLPDVLEFVKVLETWSMELQRHCPQDWNQYSALLARCLIPGQRQPRSETEFVI